MHSTHPGPNIQSFDMQIHLWDAAHKISKRGPKVPREPLCVGSHFADPRCKREQFADLKCAAVDKIPSFRSRGFSETSSRFELKHCMAEWCMKLNRRRILSISPPSLPFCYCGRSIKSVGVGPGDNNRNRLPSLCLSPSFSFAFPR